MNNDEIRTFEKLTGIAELRRKARRNFSKWTKEQGEQIVYLIDLANREMNRFQQEAHQAAMKAQKKPKGAKMRTFHAARIDAEEREIKKN